MSRSEKMYVIKRDGRKEDVLFDKITFRIQKLCYDLNMEYVDPSLITIQVINGLYPGISTVELDNLAAEIAASMTTKHLDYAILAARIAISNLHKETKKLFSEVIHDLYHTKDVHTNTNKCYPLISEEYYHLIQQNANKLNSAIIHDRDFYYNYFGFKILERNYLLKIHGKTVERPQHMLMRVAVGIHRDNIDKVIETYNYLSDRYFMHAPPTLLSACTIKQSLASCYLLTMTEDSIDGICDTLTRCALVSKSAGGIGLNIHCIRAKGTPIAGTLGESNGLVPMIKVYNNAACYIDQENKTSGTLAIYIEPWHADVFEFLKLKKSTGKEEYRAKDLSYGLWIPDLFMQRVLNDDIWSLMCPHQSPGLADVWGKEFEELYIKYEKDGRFKRQVRARDLWTAILTTQVETGTPYMLYKDHCNLKSNQQNVGTIRCSNLCTEVIEYSSPDEVAACNTASIAVNMFVDSSKQIFDFEKLKKVTKIVVRDLDNMIDINHYPLPEAMKSNLRHRPIGISIQGLADAFLLMRYPFESEEAQNLNVQIFETLYYGALEASCEIAQEKGTYEMYEGSPVSKGILQYDMWNVTPTELWNWKELKTKIAEHGIRNSLLIALSPTSVTAQILGNNNSIVPYTNNIYTTRVSSRMFQVVNPHLLRDLTKLKLWDDDMRNKIMANNGSVQNIDCIPLDLKELYKTVWEMSQKTILKMAADRAAFIDQSQSLDVYMIKPTMDKLTSMHFYGWKMGLKTGMYYLHTKPTENIVQFTLDEMKLQRSVNTITRSTSPDLKNEKGVSILSPSRNLQREEQCKGRKKSISDADDLKLMCSLESGNCLSCGS